MGEEASVERGFLGGHRRGGSGAASPADDQESAAEAWQRGYKAGDIHPNGQMVYDGSDWVARRPGQPSTDGMRVWDEDGRRFVPAPDASGGLEEADAALPPVDLGDLPPPPPPIDLADLPPPPPPIAGAADGPPEGADGQPAVNDSDGARAGAAQADWDAAVLAGTDAETEAAWMRQNPDGMSQVERADFLTGLSRPSEDAHFFCRWPGCGVWTQGTWAAVSDAWTQHVAGLPAAHAAMAQMIDTKQYGLEAITELRRQCDAAASQAPEGGGFEEGHEDHEHSWVDQESEDGGWT